MERPTFALGRTSRDGVAARNCRPAYRDNFDLVALPQGFAPVSELGARLALAVDTDSSASFDQESTSDAVSAEPVLARGDPDAVIDPITGEPDTYDAGQRAHEWITVVRAEAAPGIRARHRAVDTAQIWTWFAFALLFASAAGLVRVRMALRARRRARASRCRAGRACSDSAPCACGGTAATPSRRAGSPTPVAR